MNENNLTSNEFEVLKAIDNSEYGDHLCDSVWVSTIYCATIKGKTISGTISSLCKKGFVWINGKGSEKEIGIKKIGVEEYLKANGGISSKRSS